MTPEIRQTALEMALKYDSRVENVFESAAKFEAYIAGRAINPISEAYRTFRETGDVTALFAEMEKDHPRNDWKCSVSHTELRGWTIAQTRKMMAENGDLGGTRTAP